MSDRSRSRSRERDITSYEDFNKAVMIGETLALKKSSTLQDRLRFSTASGSRLTSRAYLNLLSETEKVNDKIIKNF